MASLPVRISIKPRKKTVVLEMDAERFEKLAGDFGFFNPEFLTSLDRADADIKTGRMRTIKSFSELER